MPRKKATLSKEELAIETGILQGQYHSVATEERASILKSMQAAARKEARINIRLRPDDLYKLRAIADKEGIAYQTLISSVLHKYVNRGFVETDDIMRVKQILAASNL